jgi:hypothetical protein
VVWLDGRAEVQATRDSVSFDTKVTMVVVVRLRGIACTPSSFIPDNPHRRRR